MGVNFVCSSIPLNVNEASNWFTLLKNISLKFFKKLINITDKKDLKVEFLRFHEDLVQLAKDPYESEAFDFFNIIF